MAQPETFLKSRPEDTLTPYKLLVTVLIREYTRLRRELSQSDAALPKSLSSAKEKEREDCRNFISRHGLELEEFSMSAKEAFDTMRLLQHLVRSPERSLISLIGLIRLVLTRPHLLLFRRVVELFRREEQDEVSRWVSADLQ